ncbi:MAG: hypothetical protein JXM73_25955 [Anaerolineae bacterium]|nr:hypothetical protein [Anaerolineae bacterium]
MEMRSSAIKGGDFSQAQAPPPPSPSEATRRALQLTEALREQVGQQQVTSGLLLFALNELADHPTQALLQAFGIDRARLWYGLAGRQNWSRPLPDPVGPDELARVDPNDLVYAPDAGLAWDTAAGLARAQNTVVRTRYLLRGLLADEQGVACQWLVDMGLPLDQVRDILARTPEDVTITAGMFAFAAGMAFSDAAADRDRLGFELYAQALAEMIIKPETIPPVVIGVYGAWGSGKSTLLGLVKNHLQRWDRARSRDRTVPKISCLEYNAWAYTDAAKLWAGLVQQVSRRLDQEIAWWQRPLYWIRRRGWRLLGAALLGLIPVALAMLSMFFDSWWAWAQEQEVVAKVLAWLVALGSSTLVLYRQTPLTDIIRALVDKLDTSEVDGVMHDIQEEMRQTIQDYFALDQEEQAPTQGQTLGQARKKKLKIVVFIDELDRCPLERIVDILEAIKLFLAEEIFIVLMAVDTRVVAEAIHLHYQQVRNPDLAREYLEKIIQVPIRVPVAGSQQVANYLDSLMQVEEAAEPGGEPAVSTPQAAAPELAPELGPEFGRGPLHVPDDPVKPLALKDTAVERAALAGFALRHLESNPRRIKRLLNTYRYVKILSTRLGERTDRPEWQRQVIGWLGMTMRWPAFMQAVLNQATRAPEGEGWPQTSADAWSELSPRPPDDLLAQMPRPEEIRRLAQLADNFLVENPLPLPLAQTGKTP